MDSELKSRAFDAFVRTDGDRLRKVMTSQHGVDLGCEATDAALAWAWEHWARLDSMANPAGYLYRVAQTRANRSRDRGRQVAFPSEPVRAVGTEPSLVDGDLADALLALPDRQRLAVVMVHVYGWTPAELGAITGLPAVTVRSHLRRGLRQLRNTLEKGNTR